MTDKPIQHGMYIGEEPDNPHYPRLEIDYGLYDAYLEGSNATEQQKREFLDTLWVIMVGFVDMGFSIYPVQQAQELVEPPTIAGFAKALASACEQVDHNGPCNRQTVLSSKDNNPKPAFKSASDAQSLVQTERSPK